MPDLPAISGKEAVKIFNRLGFEAVRQKGSHLVLRKGSCGCVIPLHKSLAKGTLRGAIKQAGLSIEAFIDEYER
jgi:predicted RNA binding protein YcfA (HicA-like mRNA interferase family)